MSIEVKVSGAVCSRCGQAYSKRQGNFFSHHGGLYKGIGYFTICKQCIDRIYHQYLNECDDERIALRQLCRKLDVYWNESMCETAQNMSGKRNLAAVYLTRLNKPAYAGKSYDDTLIEEGSLWTLGVDRQVTTENNEEEDIVIPKKVKKFWGSGYTPSMYRDLQERYDYWVGEVDKNKEGLDVGTEAIIRQICSLELDINRDRADGKSVDKNINALNTLLGSACLKPAQKKNDDADSSIDKTPMGVWAKRYEEEEPIPDTDPEMKDVDGIGRYFTVWVLGHLCKMLNIKNKACRLYEDEISKMRVEHPEYEDEDDESMLYDIFNSNTKDGDKS